MGILAGNVTAIGSYTSVTFPTLNKDYVNKTGIGTGTSQVGDLLHIVVGTSATTGYYRIITLINANSVQVDRAIHASGSDIIDGQITIWKDVLIIQATDATNGQLITNFSAQNKPLQIGGTIYSTTTGLTAADVILGNIFSVDTVNNKIGIGETTKLSRFTIKQAADSVLTGTTTVNASDTITGVGTLFLSELGLGDRVSVSSAATTWRTIGTITSNTSAALVSGETIGNGTSQTINVKHAIQRWDNASGTVLGIVNDLGYYGFGMVSPVAQFHVGKDITNTSQVKLGDDMDLTTNAQNGLQILAFNTGNNYIDSKTFAGGYTYFRAGAGAETGTARTWMTVDSTNGNVGIGATVLGTSAAGWMGMANGTAPTTSPANVSQWGSADQNSVDGRARLHERTESGIYSPIALQTEMDAAINPKMTAQAVNMTAAASGSSGITVADNDNIDFGTGNFTLVWRGSLPDWTLSSESLLIWKYAAALGYLFAIDSDGKFRVNLFGLTGTAAFVSAVPNILVDGTSAELVASITKETVSANGSVAYYINGSQLGSPVAITANTIGSLSNTGPFELLGDQSVRTAGTVFFAATYNRALSAAEVLDLYRNGVNFADKWGSQTAVSSDTAWTGAVTSTPPTGWNITPVGIFTIFDSGDGAPYNASLKIEHDGVNGYPAIYKSVTTVVGKKYRFSFAFKKGTASNGVVRLGTTIGGTEYNAGSWDALTDATWAVRSLEFTATTTTTYILLNSGAATTGLYSLFDETFLYEIGATLALESEGIGLDKWYDSSTNALDGVYPTAGSSLVLSLDLGKEALLSVTNVSFAADADTTLYTVPTGRRLVLTKAIVIAGADAGATTALSIGANGAETDFVPAAVLSNLDAANDVVILQPAMVAALPVKNKSYAAGTVIQAQVATQSGGATNSIRLFGVLY